jgi:hypothetical protein
MIYKFKSKASGDVIMMGPTGDRVLAVIGRSPSAQGIIEVADMPAAIAALHAAVEADDAQRAATHADHLAGRPSERPAEEPITLRQRAWPLVEMLQRCHADKEPVVWGV